MAFIPHFLIRVLPAIERQRISTVARIIAFMDNHLAAILLTQGAALIRSRPTFFPDPDKLLLEVKAIAINPVDAWQRDNNVLLVPFISPSSLRRSRKFVKAGPDVPAGAPLPGARATALESSFNREKKSSIWCFLAVRPRQLPLYAPVISHH